MNAKDVRPFWGRAAAYYSGALAGLMFIGALALFGALRLIGYPLSPFAVLWPPRWHEIRLARSECFVAKARIALEAHRINEAILCLDVAYHDNPGNFDAGIALAQLLSTGRPDSADSLYATLLSDFPGRRTATSEAWFRFLLVHGRFAQAARLASARVIDDPAQQAAWLHGLFNVARYGNTEQPLRELVERQSARLEPIAIALINSEILIRQGQGLQLLPGLTSALPPSAKAYAPFFQVSRLTALGRAADALALLDRYAAAHRLSDADALQLRLDVLAALGQHGQLCRRLSEAPVTARELELISIHLVRHPDPAALTALGACLRRSNLPADNATFAGCAAFLVACGVSHDWEQLHSAEKLLQQFAGSHPVHFEAIETFFHQPALDRVDAVLPLLPAVSVDLIYALYDRSFGGTTATPAP